MICRYLEKFCSHLCREINWCIQKLSCLVMVTFCLRDSKFYPVVTSEFIEGTLWSKSGHGPSVTDGAVKWKLPGQRGLMRSGCSGLCRVPSEHLQPWRFHHGLSGHSQAAACLQTPPRPALKSCFVAAQCPNRLR